MSNQKIDAAGKALIATDFPEKKVRNAFYGSGLFFKFFLWFWLAVVLTGLLVAIYGYIYHFAPENQRMFRMGREMLEENGQMVVDALEKYGIESALNICLPGTFWLFDEQLNNLFEGKQRRFKRKYKHDGVPSDK